MKIIFFNHFHKGDLHAGKEYAKKLMREMPSGCTFGYLHNNPKKITDEYNVPYLGSPNHLDKHEPFYQHENTLYLNTWMANDWDIFCKHGGGNMHTLHEIWSDAYTAVNNFFNVSIDIGDDPAEYLTEIDYDKIEKPLKKNIHSFLDKHSNNKKVLLCNNRPLSNQSFISDMKDFVEKIADEYIENIFICVQKFNTNRNNIFFTDDIIKEQTGCDLYEISYLSTYCEYFVGKNSGPSTFCETKKNLNDVTKKFLSFNLKNPSFDDIRESIAYNIKILAPYKLVPIENPNLNERDRINIETELFKLLG